jgi:tRNA (guanine-N7-)-methyltransferase
MLSSSPRAERSLDGGAIVLDAGGHALPLTAAELFGSPRPLEVELGVGKGRFLLEWATAHPQIGLLGVERAGKYLETAAVSVARRGLRNVRLLHTTAEDLLFRCLAAASVAAFHVYFPDPWPKKRHHKRRFFRPDNVARLAEVLAPGGLLRVKTDHGAYAAVIAELLAAESRLEAVTIEDAFAEVPPTSFEVKYTRDERPIHHFAYRRC